MKKKLSVIIIASIVLTSCGFSHEPIDYYYDAVTAFYAAAGTVSEFTSEFTVTSGDNTITTTYKGREIEQHTEGETTGAYIEGTANMNMAGYSIDFPEKAYYYSGNYYTDINESKNYVNMTWEEARRQCGIFCGMIKFAASDFSAIAEENQEEGRSINFVIAPENYEVFPGLSEQWGRLTEGGQLSFTEIRGTVWMDKKNNPISASYSIGGDVVNGENDIHLRQSVSIIYTLSEGEDIPMPNISEYTKISR